MKAPRTYDEISMALLNALPSGAEIEAFSDKDLAGFRAISNILDNVAYLELRRREQLAAKAKSAA